MFKIQQQRVRSLFGFVATAVASILLFSVSSSAVAKPQQKGSISIRRALGAKETCDPRLSRSTTGCRVLTSRIASGGSGPILTYSSYIGGEGGDGFFDVVADDEEAIYAAGYTGSLVPVVGPLDPGTSVPDPGTDVIVTKINPRTSEVEFVKIFGGSEIDFATGLAVTSDGGVIVVGSTDSADFPVKDALFSSNQGACPGEDSDCAIDGFFTKLDAAGEIEVSSYFGGSELDQITDVALDREDRPFFSAVTTSSDLPVTSRAVQRTKLGGLRSPDAYVASLGADLKSIRSATYLGGARGESPAGLVLSQRGGVLVVGGTRSRRFMGEGERGPRGQGWQGFVARLSPGARLRSSRSFGGTGYDFGTSLAITPRGVVAVGVTESRDLTGPVRRDRTLGGTSDGFMSRLRGRSLRLISSRYFGGRRTDAAVDVALAASGHILVTGVTDSIDLPIKDAVQQERNGPDACEDGDPRCVDAFVASVRPGRFGLNYSSYLGGSDYDAAFAVAAHGDFAHIVGTTSSSDFPTVRASQSMLVGFSDGFASSVRD